MLDAFLFWHRKSLRFFLPPLRMDLHFHPPIKKTFRRLTVWFFLPCMSPQLGLHFGRPPLRKENYFIPRWKIHPVFDIFFPSHVWAINIYPGTAIDFLLLFSRCQALSPSSCCFLEPAKDLAVSILASRWQPWKLGHHWSAHPPVDCIAFYW